MGTMADAMVAYAQPMLDETDGSEEQINKAKNLMRIEKTRLARECAKLDPEFEQSLSEEGVSAELEEWPDY